MTTKISILRRYQITRYQLLKILSWKDSPRRKKAISKRAPFKILGGPVKDYIKELVVSST